MSEALAEFRDSEDRPAARIRRYSPRSQETHGPENDPEAPQSIEERLQAPLRPRSWVAVP